MPPESPYEIPGPGKQKPQDQRQLEMRFGCASLDVRPNGPNSALPIYACQHLTSAYTVPLPTGRFSAPYETIARMVRLPHAWRS